MEKGRYSFKVRSYECGPDGRATLRTICNFLQEAASLHAASLGFGKGDFAAAGENISWVLTRMVVKMNRYPKWEDELTVVTFPRGGRKIVAWRDFEIRDAEGQTLGVASSEWMIIDLATRKIHAIPEKVFAANDPANVPVLGLEPFAKFRFPEQSGETPLPPSGNRNFANGSNPNTGTFAGSFAANTFSGIAWILRVVKSMIIHSLDATPRVSPFASLTSKSRHATILRPPRGKVSTVSSSSQTG